MNKRTAVLFAAVLSLNAWMGQAAGPAFWDNFDSYGLGQNFVSPTNGWQASSNGVVVTNNFFHSLSNSVVVPRQTTLTNMVNGGGDRVIWTDCYIKPVAGDLPSDLPLDTASLVAYFNPSGYVQVATSSGWVICSNDVWGGAIDSAGTNFVRVSVYQNYSTSNSALFVNGRLAIQDMRFVGSSSAYNTFRIMSPSSNTWVDNVWIKTNYDDTTLTNDVNVNGVADAEELASYGGYAARTLYVGGGAGYPRYETFTGALTNWRSRDIISVHGGIYTGDLLVSNSITFIGSTFTNAGTLTIKAVALPVFQNDMSWGTMVVDTNTGSIFGGALRVVNSAIVGQNAVVSFSNTVICGASLDIGTNAMATFIQSLSCSSLVVRAGATLTCQSLTCSNLVVEPGAHFSCQGAFVSSSTCSIGQNAAASFAGTVSCPGAFSVAAGAIVTFSQGAELGTLDAVGTVTVGAGKTLTVSTATFSTATFGQTLSCSNLVVRSGSTVTFQTVTCSNLTVEAGGHLICLGAFACANICSFDQSATAGFSNTVFCPGSFLVASNAVIALRQGASVGSLACTGNVTVVPGQSLIMSSAIVPGVVTVSGGGTATVSSALSMPIGGHMDFNQSRFLLLSAPVVDLSGTFSISNNWGAGNSVWVSANANASFNQALTADVLTVYAGATSVFQIVSCTNLSSADGAQLVFPSTLQVVNSGVIGQNVVASFSNTVTCGASLTVGTNAMATFIQSLSCSSLVVRAGATLTCQSLTCSNLVVEPGAHFTCLGAFVCNSACSIGQNATVSFAGTVSCPGSFSASSGAMVTLSQGAAIGVLDVAGTLAVGAGKTLTANVATVSGGVQITGAGTVSVATSLSVTGGGLLTFTSSRLIAPANNVDMNGTFTVNNTWGQSSAAMPLPFVEDFERYTAGARVVDLGFAGWGATDPGVVVQSAVANSAMGGNRGLSLPAATVVSNRITTAAKKVWTDCYVKPTLGGAPFNPPTNTAGFVSFVDTNGWLEVATGTGWEICSNFVSGAGQPDRMTTSSWTRVTIYQNLTNNSVAVFINGKLVRQLLQAPGAPLTAYTSFAMNSLDGQAYLDDVAIKETWPETFTSDLDHDYAPDAFEVDRVGEVTVRDDWVKGSIYVIR